MESVSSNGHRNGGSSLCRTHVLKRPLESGYGQFVVRAAIDYLSSAQDPQLAAIVIDAPLDGTGSSIAVRALVEQAEALGIRGEVTIGDTRCEVRLTCDRADRAGPIVEARGE